jgi:hypothetical protein
MFDIRHIVNIVTTLARWLAALVLDKILLLAQASQKTKSLATGTGPKAEAPNSD